MNEKVNVGMEESGYKMYHDLDDICELLDMDMDEVFEVISMVSNSANWHITNSGVIMLHSEAYRSLLMYKNKDKYAFNIMELDIFLEDEKCYKVGNALAIQKIEIEEKVKTLKQRKKRNEENWKALIDNTRNSA